jgi:hypothetical protein
MSRGSTDTFSNDRETGFYIKRDIQLQTCTSSTAPYVLAQVVGHGANVPRPVYRPADELHDTISGQHPTALYVSPWCTYRQPRGHDL